MNKRNCYGRTQLAEIRAGVKEGIRGPVMLKWIELLLEDRDERVRLERERAKGRRWQARRMSQVLPELRDREMRGTG
jgi:hypothetical protein